MKAQPITAPDRHVANHLSPSRARRLQRASYDICAEGRLSEEIATVFRIPFEVMPFKQSKHGSAPRPKRNHVQAIPEKAQFEITFPRVEGYRQAIRNKVTVDLDLLASLTIAPKLAGAAA